MRYLTLAYGSRPDLRPVWLPDGQSIAVVGSDTPQIANVTLVSGDGRTLVYVQRRDNKDALWRSDGDGTHATEVAAGGFTGATITPDGSAVFYLSSQSGQQSPWIIDVHGGTPRQFAPYFCV